MVINGIALEECPIITQSNTVQWRISALTRLLVNARNQEERTFCRTDNNGIVSFLFHRPH